MAGKKKKILLMSDDLRMHSGIATQSKEFVMGTLHHYDWVQLAGAVKHPDEGKIVDMCEATRNELGIKDGYLKIYPVSGYGNPDILRQIMEIEKPDAILHFTDPRFWIWFYQMEHEIRQNVPIFYYNIWDDLPDPKYNRDYYRSSDLLMSISKQTYGLNYRILEDYGYKDNWKLKYVPHGVSSRRFFKVHSQNNNYIDFQQKYGLDKYKFRILYLNRNIRRKNPGDVAMAYKHMMDKLTPEQRKDCVFVWHAAVSDDNGTDMRAVCSTLLPEYPVIFTEDFGGPMNDEQMNFLYNSVDIYINLASNEGFGLGSLEALTVGTPIFFPLLP
jgi:glycosyltransferase involved in cell wall biosynthesis